MKRLWTVCLALTLLCGCAWIGAPAAPPSPPGYYDTVFFQAFPTPTPTPTPTPSPTPAPVVTPTPTPAPLETDAFRLPAPTGFSAARTADGQLILTAGDGRQIWYFALDADTGSAALSLPLSLLSSVVAGRLGGGAEVAFTSRADGDVAGKPAVVFSGDGLLDGQALALRAYASAGADACHVFVLSWPLYMDAEAGMAAALDTLTWK